MIIIINCGSTKTPFILEMVEGAGMSGKVVGIDDFKPEILESTKGLIISGAPILLTEVDQQPYLDKFSFIKMLAPSYPVFGICFGHQIIGLHYGAKVSRCPEDRSWRTIDFLGKDAVMETAGVSREYMQDHCEAISLPNDFNLLGTSDNCRVEAMRHKSFYRWGVQFHPEVSGEAGLDLIKNFCRICSQNKG